jgi:hypothetical protein
MGWMLIIVAALTAIVKLFVGFAGEERVRPYRVYQLSEQLILGFVLLGLVMLGLAQFVRYLYQNDYQPGWILRHGDKVLYLYAPALIVSPILHYCFLMILLRNPNLTNTLLYFMSAELPALVRGLIFIAMGLVLRRIVPIIEESKTLV